MSRAWAAAAALYLTLALYLIYPAWTDPAHGLVGDWTHPDTLSNHWLYLWVADQVHGGRSLLHNDRYYFPVGDAPWLAGNGSDALPFALVFGWFDWPGSITGWVLLTLVANGLAGAALARSAGAGWGGALVAGAALVVCPYVSRELSAGRFAQAPLWSAALFLAAWIRLVEAPRVGLGVLAGLLFGLAAFQYWYQGLWLAMAGLVIWAFRPSLRPLYGFVPAALVATVPPLAVFLGRWGAVPGTDEDVFPHPIAVDSSLPASFPVWSGTGELATVTVPLVVSILAALGVRGVDRRLGRGLLVAAGMFYLLCLGPELLWPDGTSSGIPGPYALVYRWTGVLRRLWWPYRHVSPLLLVLVPLVAHGVARVSARIGAFVAPALLVAALPVELYARGATVDVSVSWWNPPVAYRALSDLPPGHLVELPLAGVVTRSQPSLVYQRVHGRVLVNGHAMWIDRVRPSAWDAWLATVPLLDAIRRFEAGELSGGWTLPAEADPALLAQGVRYVSVNRGYFPGELSTLREHHVALLTALYGEPLVRAGAVRVWDLERATGTRTWTFPSFTPPEDYVDAEGRTSLPTEGAVGLRAWPRTVPPRPPTARPAVDPSRWAELPPMVRRKLEREATVPDTGDAEE